MKRWYGLAVMLFAVCLLSSCGNAEIRADPYLQDLERVLTLKGEVSQHYLETLKAARAYTEEPSEETLKNAKDSCLSAMDAIVGIEVIESELTAEQQEAMSKLGMDQADYMTPFLMQAYEIGTRLQTLTDILCYLNQAPESNDSLAISSSVNLSYEELSWQIDLIGLNHLLAEVPETQLEDFQGTFLTGLSAFAGDTILWETDRTVLEERSEVVFGKMEDLVSAQAQQVGALYSFLLDDQKRRASELEAAGLSVEEAAQLEQKVDQTLEESQTK